MLWLSPALSPHARAFGGLWSSGSTPLQQAAEQIVFVDNPDATITAIIRMKFAGPAQSFAWLIPVPGTPTVSVSSSTVFERLDAATAPQFWLEVASVGMCAPEDVAADAGAASGDASTDAPAMPVAVLDQGSVGAYDYVTISLDPSLSDPAQAATDWLSMNGYDLSGLDSGVLSPYLSDGLNLLAFKLSTNTDVGALRPVMVTYASELPTIPIRPTARSAQDDMRIQVWVIGPSQAVPSNYKSLVIDDARIDWLSGGKYLAGTLPSGGVGPSGPVVPRPSNYDALVSAAENEAGGRGFVTELGGPASQYRDEVWSSVDDSSRTTITGQSYADGIDAIIAASSAYAGWDGWQEAVAGATALPSAVTLAEFTSQPDAYRGIAAVDTDKFFQLLDANVLKPVSDTAALFYNAPYLTRLYAIMSPAAMTLDPAFTYNFDLAQVSNVHVAKQFLQCSSTVRRDAAAWRIELPQGGVVTGESDRDWPAGYDSLPANLEVVALSTSGSGIVVKDNREVIGTTLSESSNRATPMPAQNGVMIGGQQLVTTHEPSATHGSACNVIRTGADTGSGAWWLLAGVTILALRRRCHG